MTPEEQPRAARTADRLRDEFLVTLRELDRRRHRAMDVRGLLRENRRVLVAAGAGLAAVVVVIVGTCVARSRSRQARLSERRLKGPRRAWNHPERLATLAVDTPRPLGILSNLLRVAVIAAGSQLVRRGVQRALAAGR